MKTYSCALFLLIVLGAQALDYPTDYAKLSPVKTSYYTGKGDTLQMYKDTIDGINHLLDICISGMKQIIIALIKPISKKQLKDVQNVQSILGKIDLIDKDVCDRIAKDTQLTPQQRGSLNMAEKQQGVETLILKILINKALSPAAPESAQSVKKQ